MSRSKPNCPKTCPYESKGGLKLEFALRHFECNIEGLTVGDFGSHQGGFVDCLIQHEAGKVYSVDTCYGLLAWKLRQNPKVVIYERTNAIHWYAPEKLFVITIDVGWTPQKYIIPSVLRNIDPKGAAISLLKPQYEVDKKLLDKGVLPETELTSVCDKTITYLKSFFNKISIIESPYKGSGGNTEMWLYLEEPIFDDK